ncbi:MAG: class I mannose-6-phosphate isomerase [Verrucomicrobia bacterium]|nr:class I mannose-6-phosphate isomerase [Verrucomicrobiota bacterium]MBU4292313.1 class I mannose-6-phosphate isomerase [Verrucomicrobiota bacterium]MCG2678567.1 class I mannose-6-phosphate isomerase [Kiritimatiellia bacterium]
MLLPLYPLIFVPVYKDYIWGGDRIIRRYHRPAPPGIYAESWEVSDRPQEMSLVANGSLAGRSLHDLVRDYGKELVGTLSPADRFPLLMKILDARDHLSIQVHPDDVSAKVVGGEPKTEMWYVLDADPGAVVYAGVKHGLKAGKFRQAIQDGNVPDLLTSIPVFPGDVINIPGGRIHSVGAGCLLLEVQQNSDTTFRVFDWNRTDYDGKPRELHIDQAMQVIRWNDIEQARRPAPACLLTDAPADGIVCERFVSPYFLMNQMVVTGPRSCSTAGQSFHILFIEAGAIKVKGNHAIVTAEAGMTLLVPAAVGVYEVREQGGAPARVVQISLP